MFQYAEARIERAKNKHFLQAVWARLQLLKSNSQQIYEILTN
jgi:hypothetical protein